MTVATEDYAAWIDQADIPPVALTPQLDALLQAVFCFRQQQGSDYYSTRLLSHFLLNADTGLKVAQIARLLGISRPNASRQQKLSSKQAIHQAHHRMDGRPYGKLLPRYVGPIAAFLLGHPNSSRAEMLDFIERTFQVRVSRVALHKYLKKYGLGDVSAARQPPAPAQPPAASVGDACPDPPRESPSTPAPAALETATAVVAPVPSRPAEDAATAVVAPTPPCPAEPTPFPFARIEWSKAAQLGGPSAPPFSSDGRCTRAPSC
jgi:hypothetical protein